VDDFVDDYRNWVVAGEIFPFIYGLGGHIIAPNFLGAYYASL
jgi:hypothetical protein